jgi:hypothetical protein
MNKLQQELLDTIDNKRDKFIKRFELFNNSEEYWNEDISEDIIRNLAYFRNCNEWLDAIMFYGYDVLPFPKKFLMHKFDDIFNEDEITAEHADIIHEYFINRFIVSLIVEKKIDKTYLQRSLKYYQIYTKKRSYKTEKNIFNDKEMSMSYILCNVVPSGVIRHLLGINFEEINSKMNPDVRTFDMIWSYAWRLLYRLNTGKLDNIDKHWKNLLVSWKKCFINYEFHGFKPSFVVLFYFTYCQAKDKQFKIEDLIHQIMN